MQTGDVLLEDGRVLGPRQLGLLASVGRAQVKARPRPRVVVMSTGAELREPGTTLGHDSIFDANSYMIAAAARSAGAIAYRVGIVSDDAAEFRDALSRPARPRRPRGHQRRGQQGRLRRGQGGALRARHGRLRRGRDAARQAAGLRLRRRGRDPDLDAAGQPRLVVRLLRGVRGARDPADDGPDAVPPPDRPGGVHAGDQVRPGARAVRPRAASTSTAAART